MYEQLATHHCVIFEAIFLLRRRRSAGEEDIKSNMRIADRSRASIGEWIAAIAAVGIAVAISEFLGISVKWENAITCTVLLFVVVLISTRPVWGRGTFWQDLTALFLFHCIILGGIEQSLPATNLGPRGLPMVGATTAEVILIVVVLWTKSTRPRSD